MCGICGLVGIGSLDDLKRMNDRLVHRGPDAGGTWHDPDRPVLLGHRRLSIIDLADGSQPMADGSLSVSYNGEIYNHRELRAELEGAGHRFITSHSDTEVLLHGYRQWGRRVVERLNGMWAFSLYDREKNELFLSRDRFGKKPLFYWHRGNRFAFASECTALLSVPGIDSTVSPLSLQKLFAYNFIPAPRSLYEGICKLPAGHSAVLDCSTGELRLEKYWEFVLEPFDTVPKNPEEEWGEQLRALLQQAVERRMVSDVPLGVFLSGGMDSSSVACLAGRRAGYDNIRTFSIGFQEKSFDESGYSNMMAGLLGTRHLHVPLSIEGGRALLPEITGRLDEPIGDASLLATYLLCKETRRHVTVAVGGDGADELFAGYDPFRALHAASRYERLVPRPVHRAIALAVSRMPTSHANMSLDFRLKRTLSGLSHPWNIRNAVWLGALDPAGIADLFARPCRIEDVYGEAIEAWDGCRQGDIVSRTLQFFTKLYLADDILVKVDRAGMLNSLEVRAPYLDIDLVNFVRRIPWQYKYRNGQTKYLLKKALAPVLPKEIIYRPKKGFGVPVGRWFKEGNLRVDESLKIDGLDGAVVERMIDEHRRGKADHRLALWNLYLLGEIFNAKKNA